MQVRNINKVLGVTAASLCTIFAAGQSAQAIDFRTPTSDWTYVNDSVRDGTDGSLSGGGGGGGVGRSSAFEFFGMAFKEVGNEVFIGINSNLDITGQSNSRAADKNIGYGDLFFNFTSGTLHEASAQQQLFGIRFAGTNDSGVSETGVYSNVTGMNVTSINNGWSKFNDYKNWVSNTAKDKLTDGSGKVINTGAKGEVGFGDLTVDEANDYLNKKNGQLVSGNHKVLNSIQSGTKIGDISMLSELELETLAFATDNNPEYSKAKTFGFKFDKNLLPDGDALISLLAECINDGMAMKVKFEPTVPPVPVPEPSTVVSLGLIGIALAGIRKKSHQ
jgi:hypothetical protein